MLRLTGLERHKMPLVQVGDVWPQKLSAPGLIGCASALSVVIRWLKQPSVTAFYMEGRRLQLVLQVFVQYWWQH
jgi:hypothetical protein